MENEKKSFFKRKGFWITAIVVVVVLFFAMMGDDDSTTVSQDNTETVSNDNNTEDKDEVTSEEEEEDTDIVTELTPAYMCEKLQDNEEAEYELSDKADIFLNENPLLFPTKKKSKIKKYIDYSIDYRHLSKNSSKYGDKLMALQGAYVVDQIINNWLHFTKRLLMKFHQAYTSNDRLPDQHLLHQNIYKFCPQVPALC